MQKTFMTKIVVLFKWLGIVGGLVTFLNILGVLSFFLLRGWNLANFLRFLLMALILEGLIMALIGCLSFFGFDKYRSLLKGGVNHGKQEKRSRKLVPKDASKPSVGPFILVLGILLFLIAFACFSVVY